MSEHLYPRGKIWWCWFNVDGVTVRRSTRCTAKAAARAVLAEFERRASDPAYDASHATTLGAALQRLLADRATKGRAKGTIDMYRVKGGHLVRLLGAETRLSRIDARAVDGFTEARVAEGADRYTISKEHTTLRAALKLALRRGEWAGEIARVMPVGFSAEYKPCRRVLRTADALAALVEELSPERGAHVCFFVATAARDAEAARARAEDIDLEHGTVYVRGTKTEASDDTIAIVGWMVPLLEHVLRMVGARKGPLFRPWTNIRRELHGACDRAVVRLRAQADELRAMGRELDARRAEATAANLDDGFSPNDLRRTHATWLRAAGVDLGLVARQLRHVDPRMVFKVYGKLDASTAGHAIGAALGCEVGVKNSARQGGSNGRGGTQMPRKPVPRDGIEPPTRGFSIPCSTN